MNEEEKKSRSDSGLPVIRTLQSDAALWASRQQTSRISALSQELKRRRQSREPRLRRAVRILAIFFVVLLFLGAGAFGFWRYYLQRKAEIPPLPPVASRSLIVVDEEIEIELSQPYHDIFLQKTAEVLSVPFRGGSFRRVVLSIPKNHSRSFLNTEEFLKIAELKPPKALETNLQEFTLGSMAQGTSTQPYLLFRVLSYPESFAGMLEWEKTIARDVHLLFGEIPPLGSENFFRDAVVKNQDTRVLEYQETVVLAYAFFNKTILILTNSRQALERIISRYEIFPPR